MNAYLGIDQGTHASRAILYDERGRQIDFALEPVAIQRGKQGRVEQNPLELVNSVERVISRVASRTKLAISAGGIATQRSTVLAWRSDGRPLGPASSWQDHRGACWVERLCGHEEEIRRISGLPLSAHYGASKLRWFYDRWAKGAAPTDPSLRLSPLVSFLLFHLLEPHSYCVDHCNAQRTQLMDLKTLDWSPRLLDWFGVPPQHLPKCVPGLQDYGMLDCISVPVTAVTGDQNAAFFGAGQPPSDATLINLGSGAFILRDLGPEPVPSRRQLTGIGYSDDQRVRYLREATVNGAGSALSWAQRVWGIEGLRQRLPEWLEWVEDPPVFINTLGGLGSPWWFQNLSPCFLDEGEHAEIPARVVAVVESIVFMLQANLELMHREAPLARLIVSGGLSRLDGLCQRLANLSGLPVERLDEPEATARGVAWLAAGCPANWQPANIDGRFIPVPDKALEYRYQRFCHFLESCRP